jgi:hypothetical protein
MYALAGSFGFPPIFDAATEAERKRRRLMVAVAASVVFHAVLLALLWFNRAELPPMPFADTRPFVSIDPPAAPQPRRPPPPIEEAATGGAEAGAPAPVRDLPPTPFQPTTTPVVSAPENPLVASTPLGAQAEGEGAGGLREAGPGIGAATGEGSGAGPDTGSGAGRGLATSDGWNPRWLRLPTRSEARWFYPRHNGAKVEGWAVIRCDITETGRAKRCQALSQSAPGFGPAAVHASRYFRITPRRVGGEAVAARLEIRLEFYTD